MKILITFYSKTGNTEKVANSIKEGLADHKVDILKVEDTDSASLGNYEIIFLGSGIYAGRVSKTVLDLIKKAEKLPPKFVFFNTHASIDSYQNGFKRVKRMIGDAQLLGEWDCRGESLGIPMETRFKMIENLPPEQQEQAKKDMELLKGHPNQEDLENAKEFAKSVIKKIQ